ncbi:MAG: DoxX family membrane protein [Byssovorax sp.]
MRPDTVNRVRPVLRWVLTAAMVAIGVAHFAIPAPFEAMMPSLLPAPHALVLVSGFFEILGGLGLAWSRTRRLASYGLIALYVAVFPANINMAVNHIQIGASPLPPALLWGRLPFQILFIAWAYWVGRPDESPAPLPRR